MPRDRKHPRRNWPENLYARTAKGTLYYSYRDPSTGKVTGLGADFEAAKKAVLIVNRKRAKEPVLQLLARIENPAATVEQHFEWYRDEILAKRRTRQGAALSPATLYEARRMLEAAAEALNPSRSAAELTRADVAQLLDGLKAQASNKYRTLLRDVFRHAVARGLREDNPVDLTIAKEFAVQRQRLALADFLAIYAKADPWLRRAMDLALWSLQRRGDLVALTTSSWGDGRLSVRQKKVEKHGTGLLRITPGKKLKAAVIACLNSAERGDCPYLVHREPEKRRKRQGREHERQVSPEQLSRAFAALRDSTVKSIAAMPEARRPSWHEIRALGGDLYRTQLKWPEEKIQALFGHANPDTTKLYLSRHGERWVECDAA